MNINKLKVNKIFHTQNQRTTLYLDLGEGDEGTPLQSDPYSDSPETNLMLAPDFFFFVATNNDSDPLFVMILVLGNTRLRQ